MKDKECMNVATDVTPSVKSSDRHASSMGSAALYFDKVRNVQEIEKQRHPCRNYSIIKFQAFLHLVRPVAMVLYYRRERKRWNIPKFSSVKSICW
jgi:hypothetical protein